jgi:hypothetical protein
MIELQWNYFVKFNDKSAPEKQTIIVRLNGRSFSFKIKHTARTWGIDIESLLKTYAKNIFKPESSIKNFLRKNSEPISNIFGLLFFSFILIGCFYSTSQLIEYNQNLIENEINMESINSIENIRVMINKLFEVTAYGVWEQHYFKIFIYIVLGAAISILAASLLSRSVQGRSEGFILLSKKTFEKREAYIKAQNKFWLVFFASLSVSILAGIIANFIFQYLTSK